MKVITNIFALILLFTAQVFSQTTDEYSMIVTINKLRANPKSFIEVIEKVKSEKTSTTIAGFKVTRSSNVDWVKECDETINYLNTVKPVDTLKFNQDVYNVLSKYNFIGEHTNIVKNGTENLVSTDKTKSVEYLVALLLIDAGHNVKSHRFNMMDTKAKSIAVKKFDKTFVQDFIY